MKGQSGRTRPSAGPWLLLLLGCPTTCVSDDDGDDTGDVKVVCSTAQNICFHKNVVPTTLATGRLEASTWNPSASAV